jgi:hypothetical protein
MSRRDRSIRKFVARPDDPALNREWVSGGMAAISAAFSKLADDVTDRLAATVEAKMEDLGLEHGQQEAERLRVALREKVVERLLAALRQELVDTDAEAGVLVSLKIGASPNMLIEFVADIER